MVLVLRDAISGLSCSMGAMRWSGVRPGEMAEDMLRMSSGARARMASMVGRILVMSALA